MDVPSLMRQAMTLLPRPDRDRHRARRVHVRPGLATAGCRWPTALRALGIAPGDRVAGLEDNNLGAADLFLGCAIAGAVRVPLYARNARQAHHHMIEQTQARVVVVDGAHAEEVKALDDEIPGLDHVLVRDEGYESWLEGQSDEDPRIPVDGDAWYVIRHSAGTTGRAQGGRVHPARLAGELPQLVLPPAQPGGPQRRRPRGPDLARLRLPLPAGLAARQRQPAVRCLRRRRRCWRSWSATA